MVLLEREPLLDELGMRLETAATGAGSLVLVAGEAGAGKSSVAREAVHRVGSRAGQLGLLQHGGEQPPI